MPDLQRIGRNGPGPQSFTRRQHHQQKPVGSCLSFGQSIGTDGEPQLELEHESQFGHPAGEPQQFKFQRQPQPDHGTDGEPQQLQL